MKYLFLSLCLIVSLSYLMNAQPVSWQPLNGPFGGTALSFISKSSGDIFAGSGDNQKGIYRSTDGGLLWQRASNGISITDRAVNWLALDDSGNIIAGTGSHIGSWVYKSTDDGNSWVKIADLGGNSCTMNDSGHIIVGNTGYGQYSVSKDAGYTWEHHSHPSPFIYCMTHNDSGHIFVGGNYTGYRSTDNGASWTPLGLPDGINSIAVSPNGSIFAGCSREYAANSGVYRSTNNGDSWTPVIEGFKVSASNNIVFNKSGDIIVGTWGWGIWKSTDNGDTWSQNNTGLGHFYVRSMHITNNGDLYTGLNGGGIYRSTDVGGTWQQVGISVAAVNKIAINPVNGHLFAAVSGISRSTNQGQTWHPVNNGLSNYDIRYLTIKDDGTIFAGGTGTGSYPPVSVFRSTDDGDTWMNVENGINRHDVAGIAVDDSSNVYLSNYYGLYKTTDNGGNWINISSDVPAGKLAFNASGDLYLASYGGGLWRLPKGDTTWLNLGGSWISTLFIARNGYMYTDQARSTDNGQSWTNISIGNMAASYSENSLGHIFCGTFNYGSGVWRSTDNGDTWHQVNTELTTMDIRSVAVDSDDFLYAGTNGESVFKTISKTVTSVGADYFIPLSFSLEQNYPNPFNPVSTIKYSLPADSKVILRIYNILGQKIEDLVNNVEEAGFKLVEWNASNVASGIYFYRLDATSVSDPSKTFTQVKKMIYLR